MCLLLQRTWTRQSFFNFFSMFANFLKKHVNDEYSLEHKYVFTVGELCRILLCLCLKSGDGIPLRTIVSKDHCQTVVGSQISFPSGLVLSRLCLIFFFALSMYLFDENNSHVCLLIVICVHTKVHRANKSMSSDQQRDYQ